VLTPVTEMGWPLGPAGKVAVGRAIEQGDAEVRRSRWRASLIVAASSNHAAAAGHR